MSRNVSEYKYYHKYRYIFMVDADVARLSAEIVATFPAARFVKRDYWIGDPNEPKERVPYRSTLTDTRENCPLMVWLEPDRWVPEWTPPDDKGHRFLVNGPKPLLIWHPPFLGYGSWDSSAGRNRLDHAEVRARYRPGDNEHIRLIEKAWRLLKRIAVNDVALCQNFPDMGVIMGPARSNLMWIGHEALKWLREDPQRVIARRHRPCDAIDRAPDLSP